MFRCKVFLFACYRQPPSALVVDPEHDDAEDGGAGGEDHHRGVVDADQSQLVT